jgi:threonine dehydratase
MMANDVDGIERARHFLSSHFEPTRLVAQTIGSALVHLKLESELPTGSFKVRGALYSLSVNRQRRAFEEVVAASTGNHGAAVAYAARLLRMRATIFVPRRPNAVKAARIRELGATLVEDGDDLTVAIDRAADYAHREEAFFLHDASDPDIPAGTGTIGLEIVEQVPAVQAVYVPVGDTALIRGVATAVKAHRPTARVVGAVAAGAPAYCLSWRQGLVVETGSADTIADGLAVRRPLADNVTAIRALVDDICPVSDDQMLKAAALAWQRARVMAEPSGAAGLAALMQRAVPHGATVVVVTGSNIAPEIRRQVTERARLL